MDITELLKARRILVERIASINWDYTQRKPLVGEINSQIKKIDVLIRELNKLENGEVIE